MSNKLVSSSFVILLSLALAIQSTIISSGSSLPSSCSTGGVFVKTGSNAGLYSCIANTWTGPYATSAGSGAPTDAQYWVGAANGTLSAEHNLGALSNGFVYNTAGTPSVSTIGIRQCKVAQSEESISNDTLQDDDELFFSVGANEDYQIDATLFFNTGTSNAVDAKIRFTLPTSATLSYGVLSLLTTATATTQTFVGGAQSESTPTSTLTSGVLTTGTALTSNWQFWGGYLGAGNAGTIQLQFSQNVNTGGTPLVRQDGSYLCITRYQ
jgi:hypothetical protein